MATLRDTTELRALAGRAEVAGGRLQLLYEASTRIGTTLDMKRTAEELTEVAVPRFADFATVELVQSVLQGDEPTGADREMRRIAAAGIRDDTPLRPAGTLMRYVPDNPVAIGMATGLPVLVAHLATADGWRAQDPERAQKVIQSGIHSMISVPLKARGQLLGVVEFWRSEQDPSSRTTCPPPRNSPPARRCASTTRVATPASTRRPSLSSAACCPAHSPNCPPWRSGTGTCPPRRGGRRLVRRHTAAGCQGGPGGR